MTYISLTTDLFSINLPFINDDYYSGLPKLLLVDKIIQYNLVENVCLFFRSMRDREMSISVQCRLT